MAKAERPVYFSQQQQPFEFEGFLREPEKSFLSIMAFLCKGHMNTMPDIHPSPDKARILLMF